MIEKKIKYTDFNDVEREESFFFHISKAEMSRKEFTTEGGYSNFLQRIVDEKDSSKLYKIFEEIVCLSYGEKSEMARDSSRREMENLFTKSFRNLLHMMFSLWNSLMQRRLPNS